METVTQSTPVATLARQVSLESPLRSSPEHRLLIAVLEDAIDCFQNPDEQRLALQAAEWIMDDESQGPLSFESVCFFLGLNPSAVRASLQRRQYQQAG